MQEDGQQAKTQEDPTMKDQDMLEKTRQEVKDPVNVEEPGAIVDTESVMARQSPSPVASTKVPESLEEISNKSPPVQEDEEESESVASDCREFKVLYNHLRQQQHHHSPSSPDKTRSTLDDVSKILWERKQQLQRSSVITAAPTLQPQQHQQPMSDIEDEETLEDVDDADADVEADAEDEELLEQYQNGYDSPLDLSLGGATSAAASAAAAASAVSRRRGRTYSGTESDDSAQCERARMRLKPERKAERSAAYKKSLMKRYCKWQAFKLNCFDRGNRSFINCVTFLKPFVGIFEILTKG